MEQEAYILGRGFSANARLNLQYFLWKDGGFSLHPSIPTDCDNLRVAEIGVGTGIWLVDLARHLPPSAQIDGFDVDLSQCPPKEWLPSNVSVHRVDCLALFPENLLEQYDIVHIQLFHLAVHNNDPVPIIRNLIKLLKPGGWISWGEMDYSSWKIMRTEDGRDVEDNLTPLLEIIGTLGGTRSNWTTDDWPIKLPKFFEEYGLTNVAKDNRPFPLDLLVFQLDTALMASEEVSYKALDPMRNGSGDTCRGVISKVFRDRQKLAYNVGRLTVIGQRPFQRKD
ncbi:S-adenosyl-L-methionine-dependent methyltransferase [Hypoxylon trugodes]|uniref:S-adenosyl-L-methionine-dependent methyltransferase n=1 Tax=Hypoxylon trugodes TaxID=326681 RepID=UPI00219FB8D4|nr:S-adenosyl-L-methionine-dependent methyltransferase [Hypoxylon trugodes]KAI1386117.1 S-adenosyl-L-methionine-dependent methyltransferase [Hypoxylon trugodes]